MLSEFPSRSILAPARGLAPLNLTAGEMDAVKWSQVDNETDITPLTFSMGSAPRSWSPAGGAKWLVIRLPVLRQRGWLWASKLNNVVNGMSVSPLPQKIYF